MSNQINWSDYFNYCNGSLSWRVNRGYNKLIGQCAGNRDSQGYYQLSFSKRRYYRHRIIWEMFNGPIPEGMEVDHINDIAGDDRIENLRLLTPKQNSDKRHLVLKRSNNKSGRIGVGFRKDTGKWAAHIQLDGRAKNLGSFDSMLDAVAARMRAEREFLHLRGKSS